MHVYYNCLTTNFWYVIVGLVLDFGTIWRKRWWIPLADELKNRLLEEEIETKDFIALGEVVPPDQTGCGCAGVLC